MILCKFLGDVVFFLLVNVKLSGSVFVVLSMNCMCVVEGVYVVVYVFDVGFVLLLRRVVMLLVIVLVYSCG